MFWSLKHYDLVHTVYYEEDPDDWPHCQPHYMDIFERYLRGIGDDGRSAVKILGLLTIRDRSDFVTNLDYTEDGYNKFARVCTMLLECTSLTSLQLTIPGYYLFREDETALANFLIHDQPLRSKGIQKFQDTLQALPKLRKVIVDTPYLFDIDKKTCPAFHKLAPVLRYALTRRNSDLLSAMKSIVESTHLHQPNASIRVIVASVHTLHGSLRRRNNYSIGLSGLLSDGTRQQNGLYDLLATFHGQRDYNVWWAKQNPNKRKRLAQRSASQKAKCVGSSKGDGP